MTEVSVFEGEYIEAMFLRSLLEASGIRVTLRDETVAADIKGNVHLYVNSNDVDDALPLIDDFKTRGKRTSR